MPSKSKKYSRKRNYRKRRHSRRMQRKSRSRNRRRAMFGGAPDGVYIVTPNNDNDANKQNLEQLVATGYAFKESKEDGSEQYYSTKKFNNDFETEFSKNVQLDGQTQQTYTITVTQTQDGIYNVNVKTVSDGVEKDDGNVTFTFTKVNDDTEQTRIQSLPGYKPPQ